MPHALVRSAAFGGCLILSAVCAAKPPVLPWGIAQGEVLMPAGEADGAISSQLGACLDRFLAGWQDKAGATGVAIGISHRGKLLLSRGYGYANLEWKVPATPQTKFRIWSLSKTFTATAIMLLERQGRLRLDDPACKYLDTCPDSWRPITIRQLLSHTSGIDDMTAINAAGAPASAFYGARFKSFSEDPVYRVPVSHAAALALFQSAPLLSEPGTQMYYSNPGFYALGLILERASGKSYEQALRTMIFDPLRMDDSGVYRNDRLLERMAYSYSMEHADGLLVRIAPAEPIDYSWLLGTADLYSTIDDLVKFDHAIEEGTLLPEETWRRMATPAAPITDKRFGYGLGIEIGNETGHDERYGHVGAGNGFGSRFFRYRNDGVTIVQLTTGLSFDRITPQFRAIIAAQGKAGGEVLDGCARDAQSSQQFDGLPLKATRRIAFETAEGTAMDIALAPDGLTLAFSLLGDLYTLPVTGGQARRLTHGLAWDAAPSWSPDGRMIGYVSDRTGSSKVWVMKSDGTQARPLADLPRHLHDRPVWTPDSDSILVNGVLHRLRGGSLPLIEGNSDAARFSADGRSVFLLQRKAEWNQGGEIVKLNPASGERSIVATLDGDVRRPVVSPDERWLAYTTINPDEAAELVSFGIRMRNIASGREHWLMPRIESWYFNQPQYAWTPDSQAIVASQGGRIHRIAVQGGVDTIIPFTAAVEAELAPLNHHAVAVNDDPLAVRYLRDIQRSPDLKTLAFSALGRIYTQPVAGGAPRVLVSQPMNQSEPSYSPDGRWIAYVTWSDTQGGQLWRVRARGGKPEQLMREAALYTQPAWSPDGSEIAVVAADWRNRWRIAGRHVAYGSSRTYLNGELRLVRVAGGAVRTLARHVPIRNEPVFLEGGRIVFLQDRDASTDLKDRNLADQQLQMVWLDGGRQQTLATVSASVYGFQAVPSPDGLYLACAWREDLYLIPLLPAALPVKIDESLLKSPPVLRLTRRGGWDPRWEGNGRLTWGYADRWFSIDAHRLTAPMTPAAAPARADREIYIDLKVPRHKAGGTVALRGARVISLKGDEIIENATVLVSDGRIAAVGPAASVAVARDAKVLDLTGKTIIPGFVDLHAHTGPPEGVPLQNSWEFLSRLAYGNTTTRDVSITGSGCFGYYELVESGRAVGPRSLCVGHEFNIHGLDSGSFNTIDDARDILHRYKSLGALALKDYDLPGRPRRQNLLIAARESGINVTGHPDDAGMRSVLDGEAGLEHTFYRGHIYDDVAQLLARSGTVWSPTLTAGSYGYFLQQRGTAQDPKAIRFIAHDALERLTDTDYRTSLSFAGDVAKVVHRGGAVGMGSHGNVDGIISHWELWTYVAGGMTPLEALRAASLSGAQALGMQQDLGSIERGKVADLIVLDSNPLENIENTLSIRFVMKNGELFAGDTLAGVWPRERPPPRWKPEP